VNVVSEDAASGVAADLDPKHLAVATEPVLLPKDRVVDDFAVHESFL
jgi:hypothetical protein